MPTASRPDIAMSRYFIVIYGPEYIITRGKTTLYRIRIVNLSTKAIDSFYLLI